MSEQFPDSPSVEQLNRFRELFEVALGGENTFTLEQDGGRSMIVEKNIYDPGDAWLRFLEPVVDSGGNIHTLVDSLSVSPVDGIIRLSYEKVNEVSTIATIPESDLNELTRILNEREGLTADPEYGVMLKLDEYKQAMLKSIDPHGVRADDFQDMIDRLEATISEQAHAFFALVSTAREPGTTHRLAENIEIDRPKSEEDDSQRADVILVRFFVPLTIGEEIFDLLITYSTTDHGGTHKNYDLALHHSAVEPTIEEMITAEEWFKKLDELRLTPPINPISTPNLSTFDNISTQIKTINEQNEHGIKLPELQRVRKLIEEALDQK